MELSAIAALILPLFGLIAAGYASGRLRLIGDSALEGLSGFVFTIALQLLLMRSVAGATVPASSPWPLWFAYFGGVAAAWTLGQVIVRRVFGEPAGVALIAGLTASFANTVLLGIPMVFAAYGEAGMVPLLLVVSVHFPVMVTIATILFERIEMRGETKDGRRFALTRRIVGSLVKNPLMIGIAAGFVLKIAGVPITGIPKTIIDQLAGAASPLALFTLGLGLTRYGIRESLVPGLVTAAGKLILMPAVVFGLAYLAGLPPLWIAVATIIAACPAGANVYMFSTRFGVGHGLASNGITLSTLFAVITMTGWFVIVGHSH